MDYDPKLVALMKQLNCSVRFRGEAPTFIDNPNDAGRPLMHKEKRGCQHCDVIDQTTGEKYASASGIDEKEAFAKAIVEAIKAPKPLTAAQKMDPDFVEVGKLRERTEAAERELAELKAKYEKTREDRPPTIRKNAVNTVSIPGT